MTKQFRLLIVFVLALSVMSFSTLSAASLQAGNTETYIVLYKQQSVPADAASSIQQAGGRLVYSYDEIGVAIAQSDSELFSAILAQNNRVEGVSSTSGLAVKVDDSFEVMDVAQGPPAGDLPNAPASFDDPLTYLQWDMRQIHVPEALEVTGGSPSIIVGDIDTGLDYLHPDLAANVDIGRSVSCVGGVPDQDPDAWADNYGHGTHTAGTIAAASNGIGIVGVAPNVKVAAIKGCGDDGYCWPENIVCSFMWAASHQIAVTNNSYFVDPYEFNCRNDPEQHAIWKAVQRAIRYAQSMGVTVVASAGNANADLAHPPEDTTNACVVIPVEIPGVIGVSANGNLMQKSYYSSYGVGAVQVVAPGGDSRFQRTDEAPNGRVLSTLPGNRYGYAQGTSMAAPHVSGVAALIISQFGMMPPGRVQAMIGQTADPVSCPPNPFDPGGTGNWLATCQGGDGYNGFYGHGQVNAFNAVTHMP